MLGIQGIPVVTGILKTLSTLFKITKREDMVSYAPRVLELLSGCGLSQSYNTQLRKLNIKLTQVNNRTLTSQLKESFTAPWNDVSGISSCLMALSEGKSFSSGDTEVNHTFFTTLTASPRGGGFSLPTTHTHTPPPRHRMMTATKYLNRLKMYWSCY